MILLWLLISMADAKHVVEPLQLKSSEPITLESPDFSLNQLAVDRFGNIFAASYWDSTIYKFDESGGLIKKVAGRGQGPGEVLKPRSLLLMENDTKLLVIEAHNRRVLFDAESGRFLKNMKIVPAMRWLKWDESLTVGISTRPQGLALLSDIEGSTLNRWGQVQQPDPNTFWARRYAACKAPKGRLFYQEGAHAEVLVFNEGKDDYDVWELVRPQHYREPPKHGFNLRANGMVPDKIKAYTQSFTQLVEMDVIQDKYLLTLFYIHEPDQSIVMIYDIETKEPVVKNFTPPGDTYAVKGDMVYFLQRTEADNPENDRILVHPFRLVEKNPNRSPSASFASPSPTD